MRAKRALDLLIGAPALVMVAPVLLGIALAMWLSGDRGPFLYRAERVGEAGGTFTILKVRTMADGSRGAGTTGTRDARVAPP